MFLDLKKRGSVYQYGSGGKWEELWLAKYEVQLHRRREGILLLELPLLPDTATKQNLCV